MGFLFRVRQCAVSHSLSAATHLFLEPYPIFGRQCLSPMVFLGERGKGKWLLQTENMRKVQDGNAWSGGEIPFRERFETTMRQDREGGRSRGWNSPPPQSLRGWKIPACHQPWRYLRESQIVPPRPYVEGFSKHANLSFILLVWTV